MTMTNCIFDTNSAKIGMGGGLFTTAKNTIARVSFVSNDAVGEGGGLSLGWQSDLTSVDRCGLGLGVCDGTSIPDSFVTCYLFSVCIFISFSIFLSVIGFGFCYDMLSISTSGACS
jgi:hypothetical protein